MKNMILIFIIALLSISSAMLLLYVVAVIRKARPSVRTHMDPLPAGVRMLRPLIDILQSHVSEVAPTSVQLRCKRQLQLAGLEFMLKPEEFISLQIISMLLVGAAGFSCAQMLGAGGETKALVLAAGLAMGWLYPKIWRKDKRKRREKSILRALPGFLDMITLCCQAGLSLTGALKHAVEKGPAGPLRDEFERVMREMRTGVNRTDALNAMAHRLDNRHIKSLVSNITQAEALGASVAETLAAVADQRRTERFQHAEKLAMEAPVKMIGPLVIFIFPVTFIIIFFPLVMEFLQSRGMS